MATGTIDTGPDAGQNSPRATLNAFSGSNQP